MWDIIDLNTQAVVKGGFSSMMEAMDWASSHLAELPEFLEFVERS